MIRVLAILALVVAFMATGVAVASPANDVRIPVTSAPTDDAPRSQDSVVVREGDHLWEISANRLGHDADVHDVAPYWREVVEVNTPRLISGDPDLIYPGEVVKLPAIRGRR